MALLSTGSATEADCLAIIYEILYVAEKSLSSAFPASWDRESKMDPHDRDYILQNYPAWKKTFEARQSSITVGNPTYGAVGTTSWENVTGSKGGAKTSH